MSASSVAKVRAAAYSRVSTLLGQDPELQLVTIREFCKARGIELVGEYVDLGISGAQERRPALIRMMGDAQKRTFDVVIVTGLDRVSRSTKHFLSLFEDLRHYNVGLISLREQLDFTTPTGMLVATILASVATLERALISERIRVALAAKKIAAQQTGSGWRCGRRSLPKEIHDQVVVLRGQGLSIRKISDALKIGKTSVERILKGKL